MPNEELGPCCFSLSYFQWFVVLTLGPSIADDYLVSGIRFFNAERAMLGVGNWAKQPKFTSGRLSRGIYPIEVANYGANLGEFTFMIGCTKSDGKPIKPGENASLSSEVTPSADEEVDTSKIATALSIQAEVLPAQRLVEIGKSYEFEYSAQAKVMKVLEVRDDSWIKVAYEEKWSWLNLNYVVLITPVEE